MIQGDAYQWGRQDTGAERRRNQETTSGDVSELIHGEDGKGYSSTSACHS